MLRIQSYFPFASMTTQEFLTSENFELKSKSNSSYCRCLGYLFIANKLKLDREYDHAGVIELK